MMLLSTTVALPAPLTTNAGMMPSCTIWAVNSGCGHWHLGSRALCPPLHPAWEEGAIARGGLLSP